MNLNMPGWKEYKDDALGPKEEVVWWYYGWDSCPTNTDILTRGTILHRINACGMAFSSLYVGYSKARLISLWLRNRLLLGSAAMLYANFNMGTLYICQYFIPSDSDV